MTSGRCAMATALSMRSIGVTQTGTAGAVDERDVSRQQIFEAALDDGVSLAAADLHDRPGAGYFLPDLLG